MVAGRLAERPPWLARLARPGGTVAGAGVLIDEHHLLTCAHVVGRQAGHDGRTAGRGPAPEGALPVEFPFADAPDARRYQVARWWPINADGSGDVALLRLDSPVTIPPAPLACPETVGGHRFSAHGFPGGEPAARQASGVMRAASGPSGEWIQIEAEGLTGWPVERGFSGAPVFDHDAGAVVGIVVLMDDHRSGHQLPISYLRTLWPELADRIGWRLDLDPDLETHWGPRARGSDIEGDTGNWYFTGRTAARAAICGWLRGESRPEGEGARGGEGRCLLVTGGPGTGKSALLAHLLMSADRMLSGQVPTGGPRPPVGAFDIAIHIKGLTHDAVVERLARAGGVTAAGPRDLLAAIGKRGRAGGYSCTVLADAVEEAATIEEAKRIAVLLRTLARLPGVRVLAGVRTAPEGTERAGVLEAFGRSAPRVDLESRTFLRRTDIAEYVRTCLTDARIGSAGYRGLPAERLRAIGWAVARKAGYNFLIAQLTSRWLAHPDTPRPDLGDPAWADGLPETIGQAMDAYLDTCGPDTALVRRLLTALAFARGEGLAREEIWLTLADVLHPGHKHRESELETVFHSAANYLVERTGATAEHPAYRLYHDALDQHLRDQCAHRAPEKAIVAALTAAVPVRDGRPAWSRAGRYARAHLADHAAAAGQLDAQLADADFLVHARPGPLLAQIHRAATEQGRLTAAVYRSSGYDHRDADPAQRRWVLSLAAARFGAHELHQKLRSTPDDGSGLRWRVRFATGSGTDMSAIAVVPQGGHGLPAAAVGEWDGSLIALMGRNKSVGIWDLAEQREIGLLPDQPDMVNALALGQRDGHAIVVISCLGKDEAGTVLLWDLAEQREIGRLCGHTGPVRGIALGEQDGRAIALTGSLPLMGIPIGEDGTLRIWDLHDCRSLGVIGPGRGAALTVMALGELSGRCVVAAGGQDGTVRIWDVAECREAGMLTGHTGPVTALDLARLDDRTIAITSGEDGTLRLWDLAERRQFGTLPEATEVVENLITGEWNGRLVAVTADRSDATQVWDIAGRRRLGTLGGHTGAVFPRAALDWDGRSIAITTDGTGALRIADLTARPQVGEPTMGHSGHVRAVALATLAGRPIAVSGGSGDGTGAAVLRWDLIGHRRLGEPLTGHSGIIGTMATGWLAGRPIALTGTLTGNDADARIWDLAQGRQIGRLPGHERNASAVALAEWDGRTIAVTSDDTTLRVWDVAEQRPIGVFGELTEPVRALALGELEDRPIALTRHRAEIRIWDVATRSPCGRFTDPNLGQAAIALGRLAGTSVAVTFDAVDGVRIWNLAEQREIGRLRCPPPEGGLIFLGLGRWDGRHIIVTAGGGRVVRIWDMESGDRLDELRLPNLPRALAVADDGRIAVGIGHDLAVFEPMPGVRPPPPRTPDTGPPPPGDPVPGPPPAVRRRRWPRSRRT